MDIKLIDISDITGSETNPRMDFEKDMEDLVASVKATGIIVPLMLRTDGEHYIVQAGHRRLEAAKRAGLSKVPAHIHKTGAFSVDAIVQIVENVQRVELSPVERAVAVRNAMNIGLTASELQKTIGKSAKWVSMYNTIGKFYEKQSDDVKAKMAEFTDGDALYEFCKPTKPKEPVQQDLVDKEAAQDRLQKESLLEQQVAEYLETVVENVGVALDPSGNCVVSVNFASYADAQRFFGGEK